mmetsp:Transcript_1650/g.1476  ORF Transcript_1650/g.1476 Transcript_1650/m.1476 type:complete len:123 (-) Transcript_1650:609-977(-)
MADAAAMTMTFSNILFGVEFIKKGILPEHKKLMRQADVTLAFFNERVEERRAQIKKELAEGNGSITRKKFLIDLLILNEIENPKDGFTNTEIIHEFATFAMAGMDTTGHLIAHSTLYLHQTP